MGEDVAGVDRRRRAATVRTRAQDHRLLPSIRSLAQARKERPSDRRERQPALEGGSSERTLLAEHAQMVGSLMIRAPGSVQSQLAGEAGGARRTKTEHGQAAAGRHQLRRNGQLQLQLSSEGELTLGLLLQGRSEVVHLVMKGRVGPGREGGSSSRRQRACCGRRSQGRRTRKPPPAAQRTLEPGDSMQPHIVKAGGRGGFERGDGRRGARDPVEHEPKASLCRPPPCRRSASASDCRPSLSLPE